MHWFLCKKYHLQCSDKWYKHKPQSVQENDKYKILCDFNIQTDSYRAATKSAKHLRNWVDFRCLV